MVALALAATPVGCSGDSDDEQTYACRFSESTSFICSGYSDYSQEDRCVEVRSKDACDRLTESYNDCTGDCCSDTSYTNVSVSPGSCSDAATEADGASADATGGADGAGTDTEEDGTGGTTSTGGSEATTASGGSAACELQPDAAPCSVCMASACCPELTACAETTCPSLTSCIADCADDACIASCEELYPDGIASLNALFDCTAEACPECL